MTKLHIKKGDEVIILTGKDKGQKGKVLKFKSDRSEERKGYSHRH